MMPKRGRHASLNKKKITAETGYFQKCIKRTKFSGAFGRGPSTDGKFGNIPVRKVCFAVACVLF